MLDTIGTRFLLTAFGAKKRTHQRGRNGGHRSGTRGFRCSRCDCFFSSIGAWFRRGSATEKKPLKSCCNASRRGAGLLSQQCVCIPNLPGARLCPSGANVPQRRAPTTTHPDGFETTFLRRRRYPLVVISYREEHVNDVAFKLELRRISRMLLYRRALVLFWRPQAARYLD